MNRKTQILTLGVGLCAGLSAAARSGIHKTFLTECFRRREPLLFEKYGQGRPQTALDRRCATMGLALEQACTRTVTTRSFDGTRLVGHWLPSPNPKRILIAAHGWRSSWTRDFSLSWPFWREQGCSVLYLEQRAHGQSEGDWIGMGALERYDILAWVHGVQKLCPGELPIYLCGISMGASSVMLAAGLDLPARVKGILADCGFTGPGQILPHVFTRATGLPYGTGAAERKAFRRITGMEPEEVSTTAVLAKSKLPLLLIHGEKDGFVPTYMSWENFRAAAGPKEIFLVPGAGHGMSYVVDPEGYQRRAADFFARWDGERRP